MIALVTAAAVRLGGVLTLVGIIIGWGPFYLAHWEEYHTGILIMGKFNGPTEAQLIVIGMEDIGREGREGGWGRRGEAARSRAREAYY